MPRAHSRLRIGLFFAAVHFLITLVFLVLDFDFLVVLLAPLVLVAPFFHGSHLAASFPPLALILPVAFASVVWALLLLGLCSVLRRFIRWRPNPSLVRLGRWVALLFVAVDLTYVFFGLVSGFAGDRIYGILQPVCYLERKYHVEPVQLAISALAWAAGLFGAYRFLIVLPATRKLPPDPHFGDRNQADIP
jgi:hypothetical protein